MERPETNLPGSLDEGSARAGCVALMLVPAAYFWPVAWLAALTRIWPELRQGAGPWLLGAGAAAQALAFAGSALWIVRRHPPGGRRALVRTGELLLAVWIPACAVAWMMTTIFRL